MSICVKELTTREVTAQITDENDSGIDVANLTTLVMTLYDVNTESIINSRQDQDIKNANNVTVDSNGNLVWKMQDGDNPIVTPSINLEHHIALIEWTYNSGLNSGRDTIDIFVQNLGMVP